MNRIDIGRRAARRRASTMGTMLALAALLLACSGTSAPTNRPTGTSDPAPGPTTSALPDVATSAIPGPTGSEPTPGESDATVPDPTANATSGIVSGIFEIPSDPVDVALDLDTDRMVQAVITVEGGTLSATGADGTVYTLAIPSDALLVDTTISLTPVAGMSGLPFGSDQTHSVQLSPEGLLLQDFAILTIDPAEDIPALEQIVFGYRAEGEDLILAAPVVDSQQVMIQVLHFSGNGVTKGLLADIEPVRERLGGDAERRLENAVSEELARQRQDPDSDGEAVAAIFAEAFRQYDEQVIGPRVAAAGESCAAGRLALETVLRHERQRQLLGMSEGGSGLDRHPGLMDTAARVCVLEEFEMCVEDHVIHRMLPTWLSFERQYSLLGMEGSSVLREARDLTATCLTFRLEFESTGTLDAGEGGYTSTVTSEVMLRFDPEGLIISGEAPLMNEEFEYRAPCGATGIPGGGGTFEGLSLAYVGAPGASGEYDSGPEALGHVRDFDFFYMPGETSESAQIKICGTANSLPLPPFPAWTSTFLATHIDELVMGASESDSGYKSSEWEIRGGEYFARKEWIKEAGQIVEAGTFKLYHSPGG